MLQWFQDAILEVMTRMKRHRRSYRSAVVSGLSYAKNKRQNEMKLEERWDLIDAADCRSFCSLLNNQSSKRQWRSRQKARGGKKVRAAVVKLTASLKSFAQLSLRSGLLAKLSLSLPISAPLTTALR